MDKMIFFKNDGFKVDYCKGKIYQDFIDYAFSKASYFMLVYVNYYGKGYTKQQKHFKNVLDKFKVKSRTNPSWPGTKSTFSSNSKYKIVFYRTCDDAKMILKEVNSLSEWSNSNPQDLAFFKDNQCWFYSVGHEKIAGFIHADKEDVDFAVSNHLAEIADLKPYVKEFYDDYNEDLITL